MPVSVFMRSQGGLGSIEMEKVKPFQSDGVIQVLKGSLDTVSIGEIVSCLKRMGRIEADPHPFVFIDSFNNRSNLLEGRSNVRSLPRGIFQQKDDRVPNPFECLIDPLGNGFDRFIL